MKKDARSTKIEKTGKRNAKASQLLRTVEEKDLAKVAGGGCRTCGMMVSLDAQLKATE
jgi:hypothetical protein